MPPPIPSPNGLQQPTYYEILSTTPSHLDSHPDPSQLLKKAYHRALLLHHPDKRKQPTSLSSQHAATMSSSTTSSTITIDQISTAYATLSSRSQRAAYDLHLSTLSQPHHPATGGENTFQTGIEPVDLDDLNNSPTTGEWFRACRCGNPRGYLLREADLEEAADLGLGEVMVGCADCSLWLKVGFGVVVDEDEVEEDEAERDGGVRDGDGDRGGNREGVR